MNEQKETILVTGSSGRIGYPLAKRLAESYNVIGFDQTRAVASPTQRRMSVCGLNSR